MIWTQTIVLLLLGALLLGLTLELIRKRRLREEYAVLWVCTGLMILVFAIMPGAILSFVFLAAIVLHYSVVLSRQAGREKALSQELALMKDEIDRLRGEIREAPPPAPEAKPKPPALRT